MGAPIATPIVNGSVNNWTCNHSNGDPGIGLLLARGIFPNTVNNSDSPLADIYYHIRCVHYNVIDVVTFTQSISFSVTGRYIIRIWSIPYPEPNYDDSQKVGATIGGTTVIADTSIGVNGIGPNVYWKYLSGTYICNATGNQNVVIRINSTSNSLISVSNGLSEGTGLAIAKFSILRQL